MVEAAHAAGVDVESEIENIIGVEDGVGSDEAKHAYSVQQLVEVAKRTGADLLAPQLGTAHGMHSAQPVLLPERVTELTTLTDMPIVLHGGTGLSPKEFRAFIDAGVSKANISTGVKRAYMFAAREHLEKAQVDDHWDPPSLFHDIAAAVSDEISTYFPIFGSEGHGRAMKMAFR